MNVTGSFHPGSNFSYQLSELRTKAEDRVGPRILLPRIEDRWLVRLGGEGRLALYPHLHYGSQRDRKLGWVPLPPFEVSLRSG
jgi:hypothetical protein